MEAPTAVDRSVLELLDMVDAVVDCWDEADSSRDHAKQVLMDEWPDMYLRLIKVTSARISVDQQMLAIEELFQEASPT